MCYEPERMSEGWVMIVAGEASADDHGADLVRALQQKCPHARLFGVGGQRMRDLGFEALIPAEQTAVAGLTEVLWAIPRMWRIMQRLIHAAIVRRPAVAVLMDMPDFNLRLAKRLKRAGIPVVYYISPQVWAWRQGRVKQIAERVDQMLVILPFEKAFYQQHGVPVRFVGHPLVEQLPSHPDQTEARQRLGVPVAGSPVLALLPGSRRKEVGRHLPVMLEALKTLRQRYPSLRALVPIATTIPRSAIEQMVRQANVEVQLVPSNATDVLSAADAAVVCSGTSTLQAALLSRPMVIVYRVSWLTYQILRRLVKVAHIGLVNLIAGRRLVPELVQNDLTPEALAREIGGYLDNPERRAQLGDAFASIRAQLGHGDVANEVAQVVAEYLPPTDPSFIPAEAHLAEAPAIPGETT